MKREEIPWSQGIALICTKCSKAISPEILTGEGHPGEKLRDFLKSALKESGEAKKIRVTISGCLDVCVKDTQAVAYIDRDGTTEVWTMHPENDRQEMLNTLKAKIK